MNEKPLHKFLEEGLLHLDDGADEYRPLVSPRIKGDASAPEFVSVVGALGTAVRTMIDRACSRADAGRILEHPEVTSIDEKERRLAAFASTPEGQAAIRDEVNRRLNAESPIIRSATPKSPGKTRKQRREQARTMNKLLRAAKNAGARHE